MTREVLLRRALLLSVLSILCSGVVGGTAVVVGLTSGSLSLLGFGFDAAIDSIASVALVWRFRIEGREPHRAERVETIAEGVVGTVLLVLAPPYLAVSALRALMTQAHPEFTAAGTVLLIVSLVVLPPLALAKYRVAARLRSGALRADSILTAIAALLAGIRFVQPRALRSLRPHLGRQRWSACRRGDCDPGRLGFGPRDADLGADQPVGSLASSGASNA